jgi:hypothetical protein
LTGIPKPAEVASVVFRSFWAASMPVVSWCLMPEDQGDPLSEIAQGLRRPVAQCRVGRHSLAGLAHRTVGTVDRRRAASAPLPGVPEARGG